MNRPLPPSLKNPYLGLTHQTPPQLGSPKEEDDHRIPMTKCTHCQQEFQAIRATSQFCSASCRAKAFRANAKPNANDKELPVFASDELLPVADTVPLAVTSSGTTSTHCGHETKDSRCICYNCFKLGITHASLGLKVCQKATCGPGDSCPCHGVYDPVGRRYVPFVANKVRHKDCEEDHVCQKGVFRAPGSGSRMPSTVPSY